MNEPYTFLPYPNGNSRAVTILVHGLNNKPVVMMPLAEYLLQLGSDVLLVRLTGHTENSNFQQLTNQSWLNDLQVTYKQASNLAKTNESKPLFFIGYSLGALVNLHLISQFPQEIKYTKMILLAPAHALRKRVWWLQSLSALLPESFKIPSLTPQPYRAHPFLTVQVYQLLFKMAREVKRKAYHAIDMPVLVILDTGDEMVSVQTIKKDILLYKLNSWQIYTLPNTSGHKSRYAHLIIDEKSAGKENWDRILNQIRLFLGW